MKDVLIPVGELMSQAFERVKNHLAGFLGVTLIPLFVNFAVMMIAIFIFIFTFVSLGIGTAFFSHGSSSLFSNPSLLIIAIAIGLGGFVVVIVISSMVQSWGSLALINYVLNDENVTIGSVFKKAWKQILSFWWLTFLLGFVTLGGFLLFIIPGIIFYIWFVFAAFVFIAEGEKGFAAMQKSREYVRGFTGEVFVRLVVLIVLNIAAQVVFSTIYHLIPNIEKQLGLLIISSFLSALLGLLISSFNVVYLALLYKSIKAAKKDMTFTPSRKANWPYILVGLGGIILALAFFTLLIFALVRLGTTMRSHPYPSANPYVLPSPSPSYNPMNKYPSNVQYSITPTAAPSSKTTGTI